MSAILPMRDRAACNAQFHNIQLLFLGDDGVNVRGEQRIGFTDARPDGALRRGLELASWTRYDAADRQIHIATASCIRTPF